MAIVDDLRKVLDDFPQQHLEKARLAELRAFLDEMKAAGIAKTREYDLPRPDTVGRVTNNSGPRSEVIPRANRSQD